MLPNRGTLQVSLRRHLQRTLKTIGGPLLRLRPGILGAAVSASEFAKEKRIASAQMTFVEVLKK